MKPSDFTAFIIFSCFIVFGISSDLCIWICERFSVWRSVPNVNVTSVGGVRFHLKHVTFRVFALLNHISKTFPGRCYNNIQTIYLIHSGFSGAYTQIWPYTVLSRWYLCLQMLHDVCSLWLFGDMSFMHKWTSKFEFLKQVIIKKKLKSMSKWLHYRSNPNFWAVKTWH